MRTPSAGVGTSACKTRYRRVIRQHQHFASEMLTDGIHDASLQNMGMGRLFGSESP